MRSVNKQKSIQQSPAPSLNDTMDEMEFQESYKHVMQPPIIEGHAPLKVQNYSPQNLPQHPQQRSNNYPNKNPPYFPQNSDPSKKQHIREKPYIYPNPNVKETLSQKMEKNLPNEYPNLDTSPDPNNQDIFTYGMPANPPPLINNQLNGPNHQQRPKKSPQGQISINHKNNQNPRETLANPKIKTQQFNTNENSYKPENLIRNGEANVVKMSIQHSSSQQIGLTNVKTTVSRTNVKSTTSKTSVRRGVRMVGEKNNKISSIKSEISNLKSKLKNFENKMKK